MKLFSLLYTILFIKLVRSETKVTLDILQPDQKNTTVEVSQDYGLELKKYSPKEKCRINKVKYGSESIWSSSLRGKEVCKSIQFHSKGETKLIALWIVDKGGTLEIKRFNRVGDKWNAIGLEDFNKKIREAKGREAGSNKGTEEQSQAKPVSLSERTKKVDSSLFNVRGSISNDGVFYLTCTPKENKSLTELKYGGETIWNGKARCKSLKTFSPLNCFKCNKQTQSENGFWKSSTLLSALIYFKRDQPEVVTLQYKKDGEVHTLLLHKNNEKWEDNWREHKRKLKELKDAMKPVESPVTKSAEKLTTNPITLDLFKPNESEITKNERAHRGTMIKTYSPRDTFHIASVVYNKSTVWKATEGTNERCELAKSYSSAGEILYLDIKDNNGNAKPKYYKKNGAVWNGIPEHVFNLQLKTMKGTSVDEDSAQNDGKSHFDLQPRKDNRTNSENGSTDKPVSVKQDIATDEHETVKEDEEPPAPSRPLTNCALDLSKPDEDEIAVKESDYESGVKIKDFSPQAGLRINYILNNGNPVLQIPGDQEFKQIRLYFKRTSNLLMLIVKKPGGLEHKYYEKIAGEWKVKDKNAFNTKLTAMKCSG
ncbi:hypothetical protein BEWA_044560 [Theileria equi strain WA]|uniref:Signal peptide containing protein n=1 Tax=Theileria equi strain WA TaxID=1537102 RepID=L1LBG4_THEEQ|nr:hypothetical protein BEWA_044560 [Theileria equi strain WA]EKX72615.1 hypothetical protein BEWA_044560 [Theileria equi strain WA]|eukprot:XP_004832067.1 hypothetical protein BEWA_044560 [Theileria equi strain WA]